MPPAKSYSQCERPRHQINANSFPPNDETIKEALIAKLEGDTEEQSTVRWEEISTE